MGKVYLVGGGPGDIELLTIKAYRLIQRAEVVLYDRLVNPEILELAPTNCHLVYVGKKDGKHLRPQPSINQLLVDWAYRCDTVVRLKGGDPFVFGRGGEEAAFLRKKGIPFEVVPGISSSIAVPAYGGIPLTTRGVASSFAVATGHKSSKGRGFENWESLVGIDTLVFLMGVGNRQNIARNLIEAGRDPHQPVAFVQRGTRSTQETVLTTLKELEEGDSLQIEAPAVMVVGEVVSLRPVIQWFTEGKERLQASQFTRQTFSGKNQ